MNDISNKGLGLILLFAMLVSVSGTMYTLNRVNGIESSTGHVTLSQTGQSNFSINSSLSIRFNNMNIVQFGSGYVNTTLHNCLIGTNMTAAQIGLSGVSGCVGFNTSVGQSNMTIENDGNILANVSLNFSVNATSFISGTAPSFQYRIMNNLTEANSCGTIQNGSSWKEVGGYDSNGTGARVCTKFNTSDTNDTFDIGLWLSIPDTATTGSHTVNIYAIACDDGSC